jgi:DNA-directed RNA polymerase subunit RPC12/RpoP
MSEKMFRCPNCKADGGDVGMFGAYFTIHECSNCGERFCHKCPSSGNGNRCAHCGKKVYFKEVGRVWKS